MSYILSILQYQPHRLLITHHRDHTVQFQDISAQLLLEHGSPSIQNHFPKPLHAFTIGLNSLLTDAAVTMHTSPSFISKPEISSVHLAGESLECAVVFKTGELALYRLGSVAPADMIYREAEDQELIIVEHIPVPNNQRYHPYFILTPGLGRVTTCALSDIGEFFPCSHAALVINVCIGFLAVSYADGSLFIVDMRGPTIIFRSGQEAKSKHKHMSKLIGKHSNESDTVRCLNWAVCGLGTGTFEPILLYLG
jgi:syntaxin-binding protein 5